MSEKNYTFNRENFVGIYNHINSDDSLRSKLTLIPREKGIHLENIDSIIDSIMSGVADYESVKESIICAESDNALDMILENCEARTGLSPKEMLRRLDCTFNIFTSSVNVELFEGGVTEDDFFAQYNAKHPEDTPIEALKESVKGTIEKLGISSYQLRQFVLHLSRSNNVLADSLKIAEDSFDAKCIAAMNVYINNREMPIEVAITTVCADIDIKNVLYAAKKGKVFSKYLKFLIKAIIIAVFICLAIYIAKDGLAAFLLSVGKETAKLMGFSIASGATIGYTQIGLTVSYIFTYWLLNTFLFLNTCADYIGTAIAYGIYRNSLPEMTMKDFCEVVDTLENEETVSEETVAVNSTYEEEVILNRIFNK